MVSRKGHPRWNRCGRRNTIVTWTWFADSQPETGFHRNRSAMPAPNTLGTLSLTDAIRVEDCTGRLVAGLAAILSSREGCRGRFDSG